MIFDKSYELPFPIARVYDAWVSSDTVISPATSMDIDPVVGGHYRLIMDSPEFSARNEGKFLLVDPGNHVRYTWEWNGDGEVTEIDVTFSRNAESTLIRILHTGFQKEESFENHSTGWDSYIEGFTELLGRPSSGL